MWRPLTRFQNLKIPFQISQKILSKAQGKTSHISRNLCVQRLQSRLKANEKKTIDDDDEPSNKTKILKIAIIGRPNVGKSTLTNALVGKWVSAISQKAHTTRKNIKATFSQGNTQIVILDTPGFVYPDYIKNISEPSLLKDPKEVFKEVDMVLVMEDSSPNELPRRKWITFKFHLEILMCLYENISIPSVLILNKVDTVPNKKVLLPLALMLTGGVVDGINLSERIKVPKHMNSILNDITIKDPHEKDFFVQRNNNERKSESTKVISGFEEPNFTLMTKSEMIKYTRKQELRNLRQELKNRRGWPYFKAIFTLSSLTGDGVSELRDFLLRNAKHGSWLAHSDIEADTTPENMVNEAIREKLYEYLPQEVPYLLTQNTELWNVGESGELRILQNIICKKAYHAKILLQNHGDIIGKIAREASTLLTDVFERDVELKLVVKTKKT